MKKNSLWKQFLIGFLLLALCTACEPAPAEAPTPEPTATTKPTIAPTATETPTPEPTATIKPTITPLPFIEGTEFPTGLFEQVGGHWTAEFREDGTASWKSTRKMGSSEFVYGVNGNLFSDMKLSYTSNIRSIPATYYWTYDGEFLTFQAWGKDLVPDRRGYIHGQTYRFVQEVEPVSTTDTVEFPTGRFINENGLWAFDFNEDGTWHFFDENMKEPLRSGKYVTNEDVYTEMTHDDSDLTKIPATYFWTYDGQQLTFELWGEDIIDQRVSIYDGQTYTRVDE